MLLRWTVVGTVAAAGCSTMTPAQRAQRNYEQATSRCWFQHGYEEAREAGPEAPLGTSASTGTGNSAIDVALRACLQQAQADLDRELASAKGPQ